MSKEKRANRGWGNYLYHFNLSGNMLFQAPVGNYTLVAEWYVVNSSLCPTSSGVLALSNWKQGELYSLSTLRVENSGMVLWEKALALSHQFGDF